MTKAVAQLDQQLKALPWDRAGGTKYAELRAELTDERAALTQALTRLTSQAPAAAPRPPSAQGPAVAPRGHSEPQVLSGLRTLTGATVTPAAVKAWAENNFGERASWNAQTTKEVSSLAATVAAELREAGQVVPPSLQAMANLPQLDQARGALEGFSSGSQVLLDAVSRQGYGELMDAPKALANNVMAMFGKPRSENEGANLRVNDAGRAILRDQVALASLKQGIEDGSLSPQSFGKQDWKDVDLLAEAAKRSGDGKFDAKAEAAKLANDPDFAKAQLRIKDRDGAPVGELNFKELNSWGRLVKSSQEWLREGGTQDNMSYWHALPAVKQLHEQARAVGGAEGPQREAQLGLAALKTGLTMATPGGALNARLEPDLLLNAARVAGVPLTEKRTFTSVEEADKASAAGEVSNVVQGADGTLAGTASRSPEALSRDLLQALGKKGALDGLSAPEQKTLKTLVGPPEDPGKEFKSRSSKEQWASTFRTMPDMLPAVVAGAVVTATLAPAIATAAGVGAVGTMVIGGAVGTASGVALDLALEGKTPTPQSLLTGAALGLVAGPMTGPVANALSKQLLAKAGTNAVAQAVAKGAGMVASNAINSAGSTALNHFASALQAGAPGSANFNKAFTKNFEEDLLKSMLSSAVGQGVSAKLANLDAASKKLEAGTSKTPSEVAARNEAAAHIKETRQARDAYSAAVKKAEGIMAAVPTASPAEAARLAKDYTTAVAEMKSTGTALQTAVGKFDAVFERLPKSEAAMLKSHLGDQASALNDAMKALPEATVEAKGSVVGPYGGATKSSATQEPKGAVAGPAVPGRYNAPREQPMADSIRAAAAQAKAGGGDVRLFASGLVEGVSVGADGQVKYQPGLYEKPELSMGIAAKTAALVGQPVALDHPKLGQNLSVNEQGRLQYRAVAGETVAQSLKQAQAAAAAAKQDVTISEGALKGTTVNQSGPFTPGRYNAPRDQPMADSIRAAAAQAKAGGGDVKLFASGLVEGVSVGADGQVKYKPGLSEKAQLSLGTAAKTAALVGQPVELEHTAFGQLGQNLSVTGDGRLQYRAPAGEPGGESLKQAQAAATASKHDVTITQGDLKGTTVQPR